MNPIRVFFKLVLTAFIASCARDLDVRIPQEWKSVDAGGFFSFSVPGEFKVAQRTPFPELDSYACEYEGGGVTLSFDYGHWSNPLNCDGERNYSEETATIDGHKAKIVSVFKPSHGEQYFHVVAVHFPAVNLKGVKLTMEIRCPDPSYFAIAKRILLSIQFGHQ